MIDSTGACTTQDFPQNKAHSRRRPRRILRERGAVIPLCPCCGRVLADDEVEVVLRPTERKLFQALRHVGDTGATNAELMDLVYCDDPYGGALDTNVIAIMACKMRKAMRPFGWSIGANHGGRGARYFLRRRATT